MATMKYCSALKFLTHAKTWLKFEDIILSEKKKIMKNTLRFFFCKVPRLVRFMTLAWWSPRTEEMWE